MNETNKLITEKKEEKFVGSDNIEKFIYFQYLTKEKNYYRIKLSFFFVIITHLLFKIIDKYETDYENKNLCRERDPIAMYDERVEAERFVICKSENTTHFCYKNNLDGYQPGEGVICKMKNFTLDPSKWSAYNGMESINISRSSPLISKGFFNMKCNNLNLNMTKLNPAYNYYFNSWNYETNTNMISGGNTRKKLKELAPERTVYFVNRNENSGNLFYGAFEFINTYALMSSFYINPEDSQVIFLESTKLKYDPLFDLYKELISRGAPPMHISKLKKKYHVSAGMFIPPYWDSPVNIVTTIPKCKDQSKIYELINQNIKENMNIRKFVDSLSLDKETFYYPKRVLNPSSKMYKKCVTIQWRKVTPKENPGQLRILGNGPELAEKLAEKLPKYVLVRLVDTNRLNIKQQIAIMKRTDYFIADFYTGAFLSIFLPKKAIVHEILHKKNTNVLQLMASVSGHVTYSDIIKANVEIKDGNEILYFDSKQYIKVILTHMKKNSFSDIL